ncbi:MAG: alpha-hydroxy-acid oxidizing protein [Kordiimonadaceae bacterium]|nr:alpha-hydroxy-acid oxidizing protein [Kordiimonadaceae bacterium]
MNLEGCYNIADIRRLAKKRLPAPLFHYIDGGSDDEKTLGRNTTSFDTCSLVPEVLVDVSKVDMATTILGQKVDWPVILSPTGMSRLFHHEGERATSSAAYRSGTIYTLSTLSSIALEEVAGHTEGPKMFQIYIHRDRGLTQEFVERSRAAGYKALCLTVDMPVAGNRERDLRTGMTMPPKLTLAGLFSFASHPYWTLNYLFHEKFGLENVKHRISKGSSNASSIIDYVNEQFDPSVTWDDAEKVIAAWGGPFAIKGIMSAKDAVRAVDIGATTLIVSNHGGRQLDSAPAPFDCLPDIVEAVKGRAEIILDGGIRRGTHVVKALAMGADACMMGRPYLYGLAAGGEKGVMRVISLLKQEIARDMALMGCKNISELDADRLKKIALANMGNY